MAQDIVTVPPQTISLRSGDSQDVYLNLGADNRPDVEIRARLSLEGSWPDRKHLSLDVMHAASLEPRTETVLQYVPGGRVLWLKAAADRCAPAGAYRARVDVTPVVQSPTGGGSLVHIPLKVEIAKSSACVVGYATTALFTLPMALSLFFMLTLVTHSRRLSIDQLAQRLQPLYWDSSCGPKAYETERVGDQIVGRLGFVARARSWLLGNPLKFSLPGNVYEETFEIRLLGPKLEHLAIWVVPPGFARNCWENRVGGHLFARADAAGGLSLFCVLDGENQLWGLTLKAKPGLDSGKELKQQVDLLKESKPDQPAGWRLKRVSVRMSRRPDERPSSEAQR